MTSARLKRWPAWALLVFVVVGFLAVGASRADGPSTPAERAAAVERRIACPVCDGESVYESRNTASEFLRTRIGELVDEGALDDDEIVGVIESTYGGRVLLVPRASGFDALVWALPVAAFVCAIAGLAFAFRRWRREASTEVDPTDDDRALVAAALASEDEAPDAERAGRVNAGPSTVNPDRLAELEDERRYLLRSLRDLDAELAAGDVEPDDYATLRDGYTKRAADVLRDIEDGRAALPARRERRRWRLVAVIAAITVVAVGAGWLVARSSGQRLGDDTITGGAPREDVAVMLARARALLGVDPAGAQALYAEVLDQRPEHPEALAYSGWLLYIASNGASADLRATAVDTARQQLERAAAADPSYPDPHCFLAVIAADGATPDVATARTEIERCRALDPPAEVGALVDQFAARLDATAPTTTSSTVAD